MDVETGEQIKQLTRGSDNLAKDLEENPEL